MAKSAESHLKEPRPFIILSRRETMGWSSALFILFGGLFFLGVLVGRGSIQVDLIPPQIQRELAVVPDRQSVPPLEKERRDPKETASPVALSFYTEVKQGEEAITKSSRMTKAEKSVITPGRVPQPSRVEATPPVIPAPSAPLVARPVSLGPIVTPLSGFTIQVAAHNKEAVAQAEVRRLRGQGFPAYFIMAKNETGPTWYRVRVGRFTQRSDANKELSRLVRFESSAYVVKL